MTSTADTSTNVSRECAAAARVIHNRYGAWVDYDDVLQEIHTYALGGGAKHIAKWLQNDEPHRVRLALRGAGKRFCEREKAEASGYAAGDVAWYSPEKIADLIPHALNTDYDGLSGDDPDSNGHRGAAAGREGGGLLAMVVDVRKAIAACGCPVLDGVGEYDADYLERLSEWLGGDYPAAPGYTRERRTVLTNDAALRELDNIYGVER